MLTVSTIDLSVRDAAHCLQCVDGLSGGRSTAVIHSDMYIETHTHTEKHNPNTVIQQHCRRLNKTSVYEDTQMHTLFFLLKYKQKLQNSTWTV